MATWVKAIHPDGTFEYYSSLTDCCEEYDIKYHGALTKLIETGGLAPDGKTFFDYPTDYELKSLSLRPGDREDPEDWKDEEEPVEVKKPKVIKVKEISPEQLTFDF